MADDVSFTRGEPVTDIKKLHNFIICKEMWDGLDLLLADFFGNDICIRISR
jgi:hypothetical protein